MSRPTGLDALAGSSLAWRAFAVAVAMVLANNALVQPWDVDDAYIFFRYAENFAAGNGVVFNQGERVEGYTSFLWLLLLTLGRLAGFATVIASKLLGTAFTLGSLAIVVLAHRWIDGLDERASAIAALLLGGLTSFGIWMLGGMDAPLSAFCSLGLLVLHFRSMREPGNRRAPLIVGIAGGLAMMARMEAALVLLVVGLDRLASDLRNKRATVPFLAIGALATYLPYVAWRYAYYGHPLPNTFYVKVGHTLEQAARGARYLTRFLSTTLLVLVPAIATLLFGTKDARRRRLALVLGATMVLHAAYVGYVGGDGMPGFRLLIPVLPAICLLAGLGIETLSVSTKRAWIATAVVVILGFWLQLPIREGVRGSDVAERGREVGLWMRENLPPDSLIAVSAAGAIPYYSRLPTLDMLGLTDEHIAHRQMPDMGTRPPGHEKGDGAYVLAARPDYIQFGRPEGQREPMFFGDREIYRNPAFHEHYVFETHRLSSGRTFSIYRRRDAPSRAPE